MTTVIANYEEVGHGAAAGFPPGLHEVVSVDMAAVGDGQNSDEFSAGICVADGGGPYHVELTGRLRALAEEASIPYKLDIYPYYGSDGEAYWAAGGTAQVALVGPGRGRVARLRADAYRQPGAHDASAGAICFRD